MKTGAILKRKAICCALLALLPPPLARAGVGSKAGDGERNVMLNASSANGPRQISIGLPAEDVSVYENGLPVVYSSALQSVATHWRGDASLGGTGLMQISETAIATGNLAYAVNSFSNTGTEDFRATLNYNTNHFGLQRFDTALSAPLAGEWMYAASIYQNFDPGGFDLKFSKYQDLTQLYKVAVVRKLGARGTVSLQYKHSESLRLDGVVELAPFIYVGDGSVREAPGFSLGTSSYMPVDGRLRMRDTRDGAMSEVGIVDESKNNADELMLNLDCALDGGARWKFDIKAMRSRNSYPWVGASSIVRVTDGVEEGMEGDPGAAVYYINGTDDPFTGMKQGRKVYWHYGGIKSVMATSELMKTAGAHKLRLGLNQWFYDITYWSNTTAFDQEVAERPRMLSHKENASAADKVSLHSFNYGGNEYYSGWESKTALYLGAEWAVTDRLSIYLGGRAEYYKYKGTNIPFARFDDFHVGAEIPGSGGRRVAYAGFDGNYINYALAGNVTWRPGRQWGLTADVTMVTRRPRLEDYAGADYPSTAQTLIKLGRAGLFFNNDWLSLTSMLTYITKANNRTVVNAYNPAPGSTEMKAAAFSYDIETAGWTTDAVATPLKNFSLHLLFTWQKPSYKKFDTDVVFSDGTSSHVSATGRNVVEIPEILVEIDPSYTIAEKLRLWLSFRYFGKTYANLSNALYFNGHWETFGGLGWTVSDRLTLSVTVINFLNQTGATGSIAGAELIQKDDAGKYKDTWMAGKYIRPMTFEFAASLKF